jgi:putative ABC transport system permease protein
VEAVDGVAPPAGGSSQIHFRGVSPEYFDVLDIELLDGRGISEDDTPAGRRVGVVNRTAAARFWGEGVNPIGRTISFPWQYGATAEEWAVVGVVEDLRNEATRNRYVPEIWVPYTQAPIDRLSWVVDASAAPVTERDLRSAAASVDAGVPIQGIETLADMIGAQMTWPRFQLTLLGALAASGLLLAALGCFAVLSYRYRRARREIGVRMALGARPGAVFGDYLAKALTLGAAGCVTGLLTSWSLAAWIEARLFLPEISARDPLTYAGGTLVLLSVLALATLLPARWAARVDPAATLRDAQP